MTVAIKTQSKNSDVYKINQLNRINKSNKKSQAKDLSVRENQSNETAKRYDAVSAPSTMTLINMYYTNAIYNGYTHTANLLYAHDAHRVWTTLSSSAHSLYRFMPKGKRAIFEKKRKEQHQVVLHQRATFEKKSKEQHQVVLHQRT